MGAGGGEEKVSEELVKDIILGFRVMKYTRKYIICPLNKRREVGG